MMNATPEAKKGALFGMGATLIGIAHAKLMSEVALIISYWSANFVADWFAVILTLSMVCALAGSIVLSATGWWQSVYRGKSAALVATIATGITAFSIIEKVQAMEFSLAWTAVPLLAIVLAASAWSVAALFDAAPERV